VTADLLDLDTLLCKARERSVRLIPAVEVEARPTEKEGLPTRLARVVREGAQIDRELMERADELGRFVVEPIGSPAVVELGRRVVDESGGFVHPLQELALRLGLGDAREDVVDLISRGDHVRREIGPGRSGVATAADERKPGRADEGDCSEPSSEKAGHSEEVLV
jgi:hypothetical protein